MGVNVRAMKALSTRVLAISMPKTAVNPKISNKAPVRIDLKVGRCMPMSIVAQAMKHPNIAATDPLTTVKLKLTAHKLEPTIKARKLVGMKCCPV